MARWDFKLPDIGEGVTEGEIVSWRIAPGDRVVEDQPMIEVMTDKATVTITAPKGGTVVETRGKVGDVVPVHAVLVVFEQAGEGSAPTSRDSANGHVEANDGLAATAVGDIKESLPGMGAPPRAGAASAVARADAYFNAKPLAAPAARKLARDLSVDLRRVTPTGPQGRVTKNDIEAFNRRPASRPPLALSGTSSLPSSHRGPAPPGPSSLPRFDGAPPARASSAPPLPAPFVQPASTPVSSDRSDERVPFAGMRRRIAQKMAQSKHTAAHFTFVEECDVTALKALRSRLRGAAEAQGVKLTFLPFIVKATVAALRKHPMLNTTLDEASGELVFRKHFHIGVATATEAGLIVPVVKDADRKSVLDIARDIDRLAADARAGKAKLDDLQGSTFTITSLGAQGGLFATPIINFPEVAILGVHQMKQRPVVRDGQIVIGDVMLLSLSFDHRIVDGHVGAAFAYEVIGYLENPDRLWMEMA